jgi:hypothetical protein
MAENVEDLGRPVGKKLDDARNEMAAAFHTVASSVPNRIEEFATGAAETLDATASYIQDHDLKNLMARIRRFVRRYPTPSLMIASGSDSPSGR